MRRITVNSVPRIRRWMLAAAMVYAGIGGVNSARADEIVGNAIIARGATDGAAGSIFMHDQTFSSVGTLQNWSFFHQDVGLKITPVIYELTGGQYTITGIGATRPVTGAGSQSFDFDLVSGSAAVGQNSFFGWKDGGNGTNNLGVPEYDDGGPAVDWLGPNNTSFSVGQTLGVAAGGLPRTYSMSASTVDGASTAVETAGNPIVNRSLTDSAVGSLFVMRGSPFTAAGTVDSWSFFNNNFVAPPPKQITPMIVENVGGSFVITGIGATRTSTGTGAQDYSFELVAGSAEVGPGKFLAWKDGGNGGDNTGVAPFDQNLGQSVRWFGAGHTTFAAGENLGAGQAFPRTYSIRATSDAIPPPVLPFTVVTGQAVIDRAFTDSFHGAAVMQEPIADGSGDSDMLGKVTDWKFFNNNAAAAGGLITPLLVENVAGQYIVRGIGATQNVTADGEQTHDFDLASGTDVVDWSTGAFHIAVRYGSASTTNTGVVDFDNGANLWTFIGGEFGADSIVLDAAIAGPVIANLARDYSVQFTFAPVPEPGSVVLMLCGLAGFAAIGRKRRNRRASTGS